MLTLMSLAAAMARQRASRRLHVATIYATIFDFTRRRHAATTPRTPCACHVAAAALFIR